MNEKGKGRNNRGRNNRGRNNRARNNRGMIWNGDNNYLMKCQHVVHVIICPYKVCTCFYYFFVIASNDLLRALDFTIDSSINILHISPSTTWTRRWKVGGREKRENIFQFIPGVFLMCVHSNFHGQINSTSLYSVLC